MTTGSFENTPKADALGFLAPQGQPPIAIDSLPEHVDLMHVTAAPPFFSSTEQIVDGALTPDGQRKLPGVEGFREIIEQQPQLQVVTSQTELEAARAGKRTAIILGLQQAPQDADTAKLNRLFSAGVRVMALEYKEGNQRYGSGWLEPSGPLTNEGKTLLEGMADTGLILDISHSGDRTARDALEFIAREDLPLSLVASHGGIYESYQGDREHINNRRNLSRDTLSAVKERGGLIGIYALTFGLSESDNTEAPFLDQLQEASELFPDHTVIGTDAAYMARTEEEWEQTFAFIMRNVAAGSEMEPRYPDTPFELNSEARLTTIGNKLVNDGMNREQAAKIIGATLVSFFVRALPA